MSILKQQFEYNPDTIFTLENDDFFVELKKLKDGTYSLGYEGECPIKLFSADLDEIIQSIKQAHIKYGIEFVDESFNVSDL